MSFCIITNDDEESVKDSYAFAKDEDYLLISNAGSTCNTLTLLKSFGIDVGLRRKILRTDFA
jgi:hypothetical protein